MKTFDDLETIYWEDCSSEEHAEFEEIERQYLEAKKKLSKEKKAFRNKMSRLIKKLDEVEEKYDKDH